MQWLRWYHGTATDLKFGRIARQTKQTRERVVFVWVMILEAASQSEDRGTFDLEAADVADVLGCKPESINAIMAAMCDAGMIDTAGEEAIVCAWEKRQPSRDDSGERMKRKRQRDANVTRTKRHSDASVTPPDTESDTDTEITPLPSEAPPSRTPKATRLPEGSMLPVEWASWAVGQGHHDPHAEWAKFHDYWIAKAGKDGAKQDWAATWRNWVRRTLESGGGARASPGRASTLDRVMAAMQEPTQ